uniref:Uncharacterized protein n=1 Tax=Molossus molossus TaxID=27622 RepID=A0A7J8FZG3_MOLMO|nr:hypothetical protein HJG59_008145 [Molossus molossus]
MVSPLHVASAGTVDFPEGSPLAGSPAPPSPRPVQAAVWAPSQPRRWVRGGRTWKLPVLLGVRPRVAPCHFALGPAHTHGVRAKSHTLKGGRGARVQRAEGLFVALSPNFTYGETETQRWDHRLRDRPVIELSLLSFSYVPSTVWGAPTCNLTTVI